MKWFGNRRRATDDRRSGSKRGTEPQVHPLFSDALERLPRARWAVACDAEFRADGDGGLRGILSHDGALLRFTTWGGTERFLGAPMEFQWAQVSDTAVHIAMGQVHVRFTRLAPLSSFVHDPPPFAAAEDEDLAGSLASWMTIWAPPQPSPLAFPM